MFFFHVSINAGDIIRIRNANTIKKFKPLSAENQTQFEAKIYGMPKHSKASKWRKEHKYVMTQVSHASANPIEFKIKT